MNTKQKGMQIVEWIGRSLVFCMVLVLLVGILPTAGPEAQAAETSYEDALQASLEEQLRAYGRSIDYKGADSDAAMALAKHGVYNRSKLYVDETHPLTATIYNSTQTINYFTNSLSAVMQYMQEPGLSTVYVDGAMNWKPNDYYQITYVHRKADFSDVRTLIQRYSYKGTLNSYDKSLEWMVSTGEVEYSIKRIASTKDTATYEVDILIYDRFDFSEDQSGDLSKDLTALLGSVLFREFDWESKVTMTLTVPNPCDHTANNYHLTYNTSDNTYSSDDSGEFVKNASTQAIDLKTYQKTKYQELDTTIHLMHNQPWVVEYDIQNPNLFFMSEQVGETGPKPYFAIRKTHLLLVANEYKNNNTISKTYSYGISMAEHFDFNETDTYTFRLENVVSSNGTNMIYVTAYNKTQGKMVMDRVPMNNEYQFDGEKWNLVQKNCTAISGQDIAINILGHGSDTHYVDYFDLRIWANGQGVTKDNFTSKTTTGSTCSTQGYTTHTCPDCKGVYKDNYIDTLPHTYGKWTTIKETTCTEDGAEMRTCSVCSHEDTRAIPTPGHSHTAVVTAPTCSTKGKTTYTCHCGDTYVSDRTAALGHEYSNWVTTKVPTNTINGEKQRTCARCGHVDISIIGAYNHEFAVIVTPPTCTEQGYSTYLCECGESFTTDYVDPTGHKFDNQAVTKNPTCTERGEERHECVMCGETEIFVLDAKGHKFGAWTTIKEPTDEEDGEEKRSCARCGKVERRTLSTCKHVYSPEIHAPTCRDEGYTTYTCSCGDSYVDDFVNRLGHNFTSVVTEPTCTTKGYTTYTCACGYRYTDNQTELLEHDFGDWKVVKKATEQRRGVSQRSCDCGEVQIRYTSYKQIFDQNILLLAVIIGLSVSAVVVIVVIILYRKSTRGYR